MTSFVLNTIKSQLPMLVEKYEPEIEIKLRDSLKAIKATHPEEAGIFLTNWNKLNNAVQQELAAPPTMGGKYRKRRRTHKKRT